MRKNYFNQCDAAAQETLKFAYRTLMYAGLALLTVTKLRCVTATEERRLESPEFERIQPQGRMLNGSNFCNWVLRCRVQI